jgi:hypothetical protein
MRGEAVAEKEYQSALELARRTVSWAESILKEERR